jgi:drug/metabolite transporter (DMT)-like permease
MNRFRNWHLFAICVLTWSTTWYAITYQVGNAAPEYDVALRFAISGCTVLLLCRWRREAVRLPLRDHAVLAAQGMFLYGVSYLCVYHAERHLPSGIVAVGFSAAPLASGFGARLLFGTTLTPRFLLGGILGLIGVSLIFWPAFGQASTGDNSLEGAAFTITAVLLSTIGSLIASRNRARGIPFWPSMGWGMVYGATASLIVALTTGQSFALPGAPTWWLSLFYLALAGSVLTFACYLTLLDRIGPGPVGTIGVMTPLLALVISMMFEHYHPDIFAITGAALAIGGNALILRRAESASDQE